MILKHSYELTLSDLEQYPIWYFPDYEDVEAYDEDADESTVTPFLGDGPLDRMSIVKTIFTDQSGVKHPGFIHLKNSDHFGFLQPGLYLNGEQARGVMFWAAQRNPANSILPNYFSELNGKFPIEFETVPSIHYTPISGILEGIYYYDENNEVQVFKL